MEPPPLVNNEQYMRQQGLLAQQQQLLALQRLQHGLDANCSMTSGGGRPVAEAERSRGWTRGCRMRSFS